MKNLLTIYCVTITLLITTSAMVAQHSSTYITARSGYDFAQAEVQKQGLILARLFSISSARLSFNDKNAFDSDGSSNSKVWNGKAPRWIYYYTNDLIGDSITVIEVYADSVTGEINTSYQPFSTNTPLYNSGNKYPLSDNWINSDTLAVISALRRRISSELGDLQVSLRHGDFVTEFGAKSLPDIDVWDINARIWSGRPCSYGATLIGQVNALTKELGRFYFIEVDVEVDLETYIYPNPASQKIQFHACNWTGTVQLYSITGQLVRKWAFQGEFQEFDISGLATGYYLFKYESDDSEWSKLLFIIH